MDQGRRELGTETDYVDSDSLHLELILRIPIMRCNTKKATGE